MSLQMAVPKWHVPIFIHSFIHSGYFYSTSSSPLLLRSAPDKARILCQSFTPKRHRQLQVKDLPKIPTWRLERDLNPRPSGLSMRHHISQVTWSVGCHLSSLFLPLFTSKRCRFLDKQ